jgi:hypothetical protein
MQPVGDTKYANRARLESWAKAVEAGVEYIRDENGRWAVLASLRQDPESITIRSGPYNSIEEACVVTIKALAQAGINVP